MFSWATKGSAARTSHAAIPGRGATSATWCAARQLLRSGQAASAEHTPPCRIAARGGQRRGRPNAGHPQSQDPMLGLGLRRLAPESAEHNVLDMPSSTPGCDPTTSARASYARALDGIRFGSRRRTRSLHATMRPPTRGTTMLRRAHANIWEADASHEEPHQARQHNSATTNASHQHRRRHCRRQHCITWKAMLHSPSAGLGPRRHMANKHEYAPTNKRAMPAYLACSNYPHSRPPCTQGIRRPDHMR